MTPNDLPRFSAVHLATHRLIDRGRTAEPDGQAIAGMFRALEHLPFELVDRAYMVHVRDPERGRFVPLPADITHAARALVGATASGHLDADEAWAIALTSADERETVVWTDLIERAFSLAARPILLAGDQVGARVAFRAAYSRVVDAERAAGRPPAWRLSEGTDPERKRAAVESAIALGRLTLEGLPHEARVALARVTTAPQLAGNMAERLLQLADKPGATCPPDIRERLQAIAADARARAASGQASVDAANREHTRQLQEDAAMRLRDLGESVPVDDPDAMRSSGRELLEAVRRGFSFIRRAGHA